MRGGLEEKMGEKMGEKRRGVGGRIVFCLPAVFLLIFLFSAASYGSVKEKRDLLQFTAQGHVLGFAKGSVYVASGSHALKVEFAGGNSVTPAADETGASDSPKAAPLSRVTYAEIWDGVTAVYEKDKSGIVKSTYTVASGSPERIRLRYNRPLTVDRQGNLVIQYDTGTMTESKPVAWQVIEGRKQPVQVAYSLRSDREVGFTVGDYNKDLPVVIDPVLTWNTFLGGSGTDYGYAIAVDTDGNVYVAGQSSATWQGDSAPVRAYTSGNDAFAAKLNSSGTLQWNTFLGGSGSDSGLAVAVDGSGDVYVGGFSSATWGTPVRAYTGSNDAFAVKLNSSGALQWNTFLGGSGNDRGMAITADGSGNVYVGGTATATWGSPVRGYTASDDAFAVMLNSSGALQWNTFLGGSGVDYGRAIAVDGSGNVYVGGYSAATWGDPVRAYTGSNDAFAAKLNNSGALQWNTFLGDSGNDIGYAVAVDDSGNVYVAGNSSATWGTPVRGYTGSNDAFAAKLNNSGALQWNTFLGSAGNDEGGGIAVDGSGNVYVVGTSSATWGDPVRAYTASIDAFAAKLNNSGALQWNTFLGSAGNDKGFGVSLDSSGNVFVAARSDATWQEGSTAPVRGYTGGYDAFVAKMPNTPTLITLRSFTGLRSGADVVLKWETGAEIANAGFHVWRSLAKAGPYARITQTLIAAEGSPSQGANYTYTDRNRPERTWYYKLEDIDNRGKSTFHGPIAVAMTAPLETNITLVSPANGTPLASTPMSFSWSGEGFSGYRLQFCASENFTGRVITVPLANWVKAEAYTPSRFVWNNVKTLGKNGAAVYWRVVGKQGKTVMASGAFVLR